MTYREDKKMNKSDTPIVVAGGAGFLGQNVILYLMGKGRQCIIVDHKSPNMSIVQQAVEAKDVGLIISDLMDISAVEKVVDMLPSRFHLVNLATIIEGTTEVSLETKKTIGFHSGIAMNMSDSWQDRLASICYISSWEVYGVPKRLPIDENHETNPFNVYGIGKLMAENYLRVFCQSLGIPLTILRLSHLYGPGEWHNKAIPNFIKNCITRRTHKLFGGGKDLRESVNVRDVAYAILLSIDRTNEGIFNIAGGRSLYIRQILETVQSLMGTNLPIEELPADRPPLDLSFDLTRAKQDLGYEPQITLEDGLREEIEWFYSVEEDLGE